MAHESEVEIPFDRELYRTFFVILDRPDFLTGPGVLFFLIDGNEIIDETIQKYNDIGLPHYGRGAYAVYQVWRSSGMVEAARRLAMIPPGVPS